MHLTRDRKAPQGKITEPGCFVGLPLSVYHDDCCVGPSISSSGLRTIWSQSAAHYWCRSPLNPDRLPPEDKPHFALGRVAHTLLLEGRAGLLTDYALRPDDFPDYRSKEARVWRDEQILAGKTIITPDDLEKVEGMAKALGAHPLVQAGILNGAVERSLIWRDAETGVWLKARPDVIPNASGLVADLKTTTSVTTPALQKSLAEFSYHVQAAIVAMGMREVLDVEMEEFALVWVEKTPPFCVRVTTLAPEDISRGRAQARAALRVMAKCLETGEWPGPGGHHSDAECLSVPQWQASRIDAELELTEAIGPSSVETLEVAA